MADEQLQGALTLAGAAPGAPNPATDPRGALNAFMQDRMQQNSNYLTQQQEAYNDSMKKYAEMVAQSQTPEASEAGRWGAISEGLSSVAPTWGNIGPMLGKMGASYGKFQEGQEAQNLKGQGDLAKLQQGEVVRLEGKDPALMMQKSMFGQAATILADGTPVFKAGDAYIGIRPDGSTLHIKDPTKLMAGADPMIAAARSMVEKWSARQDWRGIPSDRQLQIETDEFKKNLENNKNLIK